MIQGSMVAMDRPLIVWILLILIEGVMMIKKKEKQPWPPQVHIGVINPTFNAGNLRIWVTTQMNVRNV